MFTLIKLTFKLLFISLTKQNKEAITAIQTEVAIAYLKRETRPLDQLGVEELRYLRTQVQRGAPASSNKTNQLHRIDYRIANLS